MALFVGLRPLMHLATTPWVAQHLHHVVIAGDDPKAERALMDRSFGSQPGVRCVGIAYVVRVARVEVGIERHHTIPTPPFTRKIAPVAKREASLAK